jgi:hypothetical protein
MRRDGIPYVKNGVYNPPFPAVPLEDMTLEEIEKKYLKMCAKSQGDPAVCSKCKTPCREGKRAIQLLANEIYNDPHIPLYGGKTLIEKAREENMLRRKKMEEENKKKETKKMENKTIEIENWYEKAMASDDPKKWVAENFNLSGVKAAKKLYQYRYNHKLTAAKGTPLLPVKASECEVVEKDVKIIKETVDVNPIEAKIEALMKLQEKHKNIMIEMQAQYEKAKANYEEIKKKVDTLCNAMDIMNE